MKPYRVIHFVSGDGTGSTRIVIDLALGQQQGNLFETLLIFRRSKRTNQFLLDELQKKKINFFTVPSNPKYRTIKELVRIITDFKPQVFVAHGNSEHIWGRIAAKISKVPVIFQVEHNTEKYQPHRYLESRILAHFTNKIICVSHGVKDYLIKLGFNRNKMEVIYNGINIEPFLSFGEKPFPDRLSDIVMVSRFARQKDQNTLIMAIKILQELEFKVKLLLVGGGKKSHRLKSEELCKSLNLMDQITFLGQMEGKEIPELLSNHQIFVLSTHHEGLPGVVIEAMAAGCLVIGSNVVGVSELISDGETGFLIPPQNPKALADKIKYVLAHPDLAAKIGKKAQCFICENFGLERMIRQYDHLFLLELNKKS
jgi:glycosyltransferase involved in cell wall biosynthesis